jgi:translation initiation factor 2B subunit (eIF-2B alpha/beta/delta family)
MDLAQLLQRLRADKTSGATSLLELAMDILETFADRPSFQGLRDFHQALEALIRALITAQPSMAPMINLAQQVLQACPEGSSPAPAQRQLRQALATLRQHIRLSTAALRQQILAVLPPQAVILTYSNSATVTAALHYAHNHGRVRRVVLSESRPAYDGRPQTLALLQHGITVEYSIDMALFERLTEAQVVLVGADAVFPHGVVNKLGTHTLAHMARLHRTPIFSLCATHKFLPAAAAPLLRFADHPGNEVWSDAPAGLRIRNRYFDTTPLNLFSGIVSEEGIYAPAALRGYLQRWELSPILQRLALDRASGDDHRALTPNGAPSERLEER